MALTGVFLLTGTQGWAENIEFVFPAHPFYHALTVVLAIFLVILIGVFLYGLRWALGDKKVHVPIQVKKDAEKVYIEKYREEYKKKNDALNARIKSMRQQYSMIFSKVKNLTMTLDPGQMFRTIMDMLEQEMGVGKFILFLIDKEKEELYPFRWVGFEDNIRITHMIPLRALHYLTYSVKKKQMVYRLTALSDPETRGLAGRDPLPDTLLALPIVDQSVVYGVVYVESFLDGKVDLDENDLRFYSTLTSFMGLAMANANVFLQTRAELTSTREITEKQMQEKKLLKEIFSRYTSPELVETLMKNQTTLELGGITKEATILFSDIQGFTAFSSTLTPIEVVNSMNEYLSRMTSIVLDHEGEIDKFIGDAIMARFGVLCDLPNHGSVAVQTAIAMVEEARKLQNEWEAKGRKGFSIRVGIATGSVLAGNIGSERRQEFTVMGATVNLASRLESLNKDLKTTILIDENTQKQLGPDFKIIPRENVEIRGLEGTMRVFEVSGYSGGATKAKVISLKDKIASGKFHSPPGESSVESHPASVDATEKQLPEKLP